MTVDLPSSWRQSLQDDLAADYFADLLDFVAAERRMHEVFPLAEDVFSAFRLTPLDVVRVVMLGQDPYHDNGQAHGLCFSVRPGVKPPPSLMNIFKELQADVGCDLPSHGCLESWARQGIMMINAVLTVRAHQANSHRNRGWERFTDAVIEAVNSSRHGVVFVLWGKPAQKKRSLIDLGKHLIIEAPHPSPLSAHRGFFGSRPFSKINQMLIDRGETPIDWCLGSEPATRRLPIGSS